MTNKIFLSKKSYFTHIIPKHNEISLEIIEKVLISPTYIFKPSKSSKDFYYEKNIDGKEYRVVVTSKKRDKRYFNRVRIITAYKIATQYITDLRRVYCIYNENEPYISKQKQLQSESEKEYFEIIFSD
ncbi:hypothetical protein BAZO_19723 [Schinkia azotoformans LMG 9581]|uniref:Uncharacterized protein n=1 Tax=Schinkia azotoformans LMG 9581 TaxID=1131731 RepID=K6D3S3_SCHAZ|nr:hypothetical protein BAZO_19723 [Schinkia azotoformans LMG 9581]